MLANRKTESLAGVRAAAGRLRLVVVGPSASSTQPLADAGEATIGRDADCQIHIDDPSISRRHARLRLGSVVTIEDLGSSNGTRVRGLALVPGEPIELQIGDAIQAGLITLVLQAHAAPLERRRIRGHGYFEGRLEEECTRAIDVGARFGVLRVSCDDAIAFEVTEQVLCESVRPNDVVGVYGPGDYEVLLVDLGPDEVAATATRIRTRLRDRKLAARTGVAGFPGDGRTADALLLAAAAARRDGPDRELADIIVRDPAMESLYRLSERLAIGHISVLILGETGVGKDVLAEAIHRLSPRAGKPFVRLNCAALPEALLESELFGHERGAFTGAGATKLGLLETGDGGTVFLDEIGEMPMALQAKLLRVVEDRKILRLGGIRSRAFDVRFLSATNRDLEAEVAAGRFRRDFFFRLNGVSLVVPPLRERVVEIEWLARSFVAQAARELGREPPAIAPDAVKLLARYPWPGNIRELKNAMDRAVLLCTANVITRDLLPVEKMASIARTVAAELAATPSRAVDRAGTDTRTAMVDALATCGGNQSAAAKLLGISRKTLIRRMIAFGLPRPRMSAPGV